MNIVFNDTHIELSDALTIAELLTLHKIGGSFAVAINQIFISKNNYHRIIQDNDHIDIVIPMQGG